MSGAEEWRAVAGHEGKYEVSDGGSVRSLLGKEVRVLRAGVSSNGYLTVSLGGRSFPVQHLVARAFLGLRPAGALVLHSDGQRSNNAAANLRYGSFSDNAEDRTRHGRRKLLPQDVKEMRRRHALGEAKAALALAFGVSRRHVSNVVRRAQYRSVE